MANVVRDPKEHPDAILPDLSKPDPLVTFTKDDIAFVYGSKWKQRYFKKVRRRLLSAPRAMGRDASDLAGLLVAPKAPTGGPPFILPTTCSAPPARSATAAIPSTTTSRPKTVTEWNVGCEKCHGPGGEHVQQPSASNIVNPARLDYVQANDVCIQCHSQGRPLKNPDQRQILRLARRLPVGQNLKDFWKLEEHKLGETTFTHFADGTAHKNRMQGNDFVHSLMYTHGVTCFSCHDVHGTENNADLLKPASVLCLECHGPNSPNGPHAPPSKRTRITSRQRGAANASHATCPRSSRPSQTSTCGRTPSASSRPARRQRLRSPIPVPPVTLTNRSIGLTLL